MDITLLIYRMKTSAFLILLFASVACPFRSAAWGVLGHRVAGGIAEHYITSKARGEIQKLLGNESVAMAGNWADFIRSDPSYNYLLRWHYINFRPGLTEAGLLNKLESDTAQDLYVKINFLIKALKARKATRDKQVFYLKLLIHFVADAHQPMHMGQQDDRGGNNIKVYWFGTPSNLHRVWDDQLVELQQLSYTEHVAAINFPPPGAVQKWQQQGVSTWMYESYKVVQQLYAEVKAEDKLSYNYNYYHVNIMNEQLLKAGIRLAGVLNDIFGR